VIKSAWISALVLAMGAAFASSVGAQTVNGSNYRQYARCSETIIGGKVYSTFGPGPCPPGTKYSPSYGSYENDMAMRRMENSVAGLGQAQQAVLALAQAMADRMRQESEEILRNKYIDLDVQYLDSMGPLYVETKRVFPRIEVLSIAQAGGVIFSTQVGEYAECIVPDFSNEKKAMGGWTYSILAGESACKVKKDDVAYTPIYANTISSASSDRYVNRISVKAKGDAFDVCLRNMGTSFACRKGVSVSEIAFIVGFFGDRRQVTDVVSFVGVRGDSLLFLYRPGGFPDQSRPDRVVEVTANLSESRVVKVGPYTFEVVDWSPTNIVAKLVAVD